MPHRVAQTLLFVLMFPVAIVTFSSTMITLDRVWGNYNDPISIEIAGAVTWLVVAVYWILLWRQGIVWTFKRRVVPLIGGVIGLLIGLAGRLILLNSGNLEEHLLLLCILIPSLWLISTIIFWQETAEERSRRLGQADATISCPACGYNLTGLTEARCPECGAKFTLNELFATQNQHHAVAVD